MENELDRITNQGILERMLQSHRLLSAPEVCEGLPEYGCAQTYPFTWFSIEDQMAFLTTLNLQCFILFARNLRILRDEFKSLFADLRLYAGRVASAIDNITNCEMLMQLTPRTQQNQNQNQIPPVPVRPIVISILLLARRMHVIATPTLARFMRFAKVCIGRCEEIEPDECD